MFIFETINLNITTIKIIEVEMSIQTAATKLLFKLPKPILNKIMRSIPQSNKSNSDKEKPWHLKGNWAPVKDEIVIENLEIKGEIPKEISGMYLRNGMNPVSGYSDHWFFGNGMLHGVKINDGKASYMNKYVRTPYFEEDMGMMEGSFDLKASPANTHVIRHAGKILTLEEAHLPWSVDEDLNTIDSYDFNGKLNGPMTAHPRVCPETGELLFFGYQMMQKPYLTYHRVSKEGELVQSEEIDIPKPVMMHDWNITRNYVIFMDLPLVFDLDDAVSGSDPFGFKPECGARLGVMPRNGSNSDIKWIEINPCFVFHPMNAYEENEKIILHVCRQNKAMVGGMDEIYGGEDTTGKIWKWTINLTSGTCSEEQIDDRPCDFARVDDRLVGLKAKNGYAMALNEKAETLTFDQYLYKFDLENNKRFDHNLGDNVFGGEPVFVPKSGSSSEDDGWVMAIVYDANIDKSKLIIVDTENFDKKPVGEIILPQRVPFGAHGSWLSN